MSYDRQTLLLARNHIDSFIAKATGINKPMEGFRQTGVIDQLKDNMQGALTRQILVIADRLKNLNNPQLFPDNMEPLTDDQLSKLRQWVYHSTPGVAPFVSNDAIYVKLKASFEWGIGVQYQRWGLGSVKLAPQNDRVLQKKSGVYYKGEDTGLGGLFGGNEGTNLLGNGFYLADTETQARMFGDRVTKYNVNVKKGDLLPVKSDDALNNLYKKVMAAYPGEDLQASIPKYVQKLGYKGVAVDPVVEPRGGTVIYDEKLIDFDTSEVLPKVGFNPESGFIEIGGGNFSVTNPEYIAALQSSTNYLLQKSNLDETTRDRLMEIIEQGKIDGLTNDEVASLITDEFDSISDWRADMIARTEVANAMSDGQLAGMKENGVGTKAWVAAGEGKDEICSGNVDDGFIPTDQAFSSGDDAPPGHPNCECYLEAGEINLDDLADNLWSGE